jgi:WYL domain-containing protein
MRETIAVRAFGAKLQAPPAEHLATIQGALLDHGCLRLRYYSLDMPGTFDVEKCLEGA